MKKHLYAVLLALLLAGCQIPKSDGTVNLVVGQPRLVFADGGFLVVDQEPLILRGMKSVTWTLPDDGSVYDKFSVTIDSLVKRAVSDGKSVRYVPVDPKPLKKPLDCKPNDGPRFTCTVPTGFERGALYTYTIKFTRNGQPIELDPTVMPE